jgi:hypothetical protein
MEVEGRMIARTNGAAVGFALMLAAWALAGCENEAASFQDPAQTGHSLTLIREQRVLWNGESDVALVVARFPDCQRRHGLATSPPGKARVEVHRANGRAYLLSAQDEWYFADAETCQLEVVEAPRAGEEGEILGAFDRKQDRLRFIPAETEPGEK